MENNKFHPSLIVLLLFIIVWHIASFSIESYLLPSPIRVFISFITIIKSGVMWPHLLATLLRVSVGFLLAVAFSVIFTLFAYKWDIIKRILEDVNILLNSISIFIWITLAIIWFGISYSTPIFVTLMVALPLLLSYLLESLDSLDKKLLEMATIYRLKKIDEFRHIIFPSLLPKFVGVLRSSFGLSLKVSVVAELFGVSQGIGYMLNYSRETLNTDQVFAWAFILIIVMFLCDKYFFSILQKNKQYEKS